MDDTCNIITEVLLVISYTTKSNVITVTSSPTLVQQTRIMSVDGSKAL